MAFLITSSRRRVTGLILTFIFVFPLSVFAETVLITGSNSGIGLEFAKQYAAKGWTVIATHRRDTTPDTLQALSAKYNNVRPERMDVTRHDEIDALSKKLKDTPIDVLINNAGIVRFGDFNDPAAGAAQSLGTLNYNQFDPIIHTNVMGPTKVVEAFVDQVKASKQKKIVNISSAAGTVSVPPTFPGFLWYRASKAALNSIMVSLAQTLKEQGITVVMFHPGFVRVERLEDLDLPGMVETKDSVSGMIKVIDGLTVSDSGSFFTHTGDPQPW